MKESDLLKASINDEIAHCNEFLEKASDISDIVPVVQERKEEAEAKAQAISSIPDDVLDEIAPQLLQHQARDREKLSNFMPALPSINVVYVRAGLTSGSTSSDSELIASVIRTQPIVPEWAGQFMSPFNELADKQDRISRIRNSYSKIKPFLGDYIDTAVITISSARGGADDVDHASMRLRDVLEKVWGELSDMARPSLSESDRKRRLKHGTTYHRKLVAEALSPSEELVGDLEELLENFSSLHSDLSSGSKDPFNNDLDYLEDVYSRWILHLFNIANMLSL